MENDPTQLAQLLSKMTHLTVLMHIFKRYNPNGAAD